METSWAISPLTCNSAHAAVMLQILVFVSTPRWKNRGVASALMREMIEMCDNWLRVDRIELTVFIDNAPAIKVYKKFGFEIEGTGKKYALRNGEYVDAYYMARVK
ncbi:N-acetyltransferase GCN5 [Escherichia coli]|uniref:N-acetyltransferase GCN5 n=1 Tax=Escherichia coli TaxID=562 RepID=A0A485J9Q4_ECOLX|nr:N-acetyltransferase GCN5 [Escherichia coli]